jgi:hypothetical protein
VISAAAVSRVARADDPEDSRESSRRWYGWQIFLVDAPLVALVATTPAWPQANGTTAAITLDAIAFAFIAPIVHVAHGDTSGASVALHLLLPAGGALLGALTGSLGGLSCIGFNVPNPCNPSVVTPANGAEVGFAVFAGAAMIVDALVFSWEPRDRDRDRSSSQSSWTIAPTMSSRGGGLTLVGAF